MIQEFFDRIVENINLSYKKSNFASIGDIFLSKLSKFPEIKYFGRRRTSTRFFHPLIFILIFIIFLGVSDAPISYYGTFTLFLGLFGFFLGVKIKFKKIELPEKFFYPSLIIFFIFVVLTFYNWSIFSKLGLIPFSMIYLSQKKYSFEIYLTAFVVSLLIFFQIGYWAISLPYLFLSLLFMALSLRHNEDYHIKNLKSFLVLFSILILFGQYPSILPFALGYWIFFFLYYLMVIIFIGNKGKLHEIVTNNLWKITFLLIVIGTFYWILDLVAYGGIPILEPLKRGSLDPWYTMAAHLLPLGTILLVSLVGMEMEKKKARSVALIFVVFTLITMGILGYRTQIALTIIGVLIASAFTELITLEEITILGGAGALGLIAMTGLRNIILQTKISVIDAIRYRVGLTLSSYDILAQLGGLRGFTHGFVHVASYPSLATLMPGLAYSPRRYIGVFVGAGNVSITSTIMGPLVIDFGIIGVFLGMFFLGFLLRKSHDLIKKIEGREKALFIAFYSIFLGYAIIGIETGIVDFEVLLTFFVGFLYILYRG